MRSTDAVEQLRSELGQDLYFIEINAAKNREMTERLVRMASPDEFDYAALGYTLHNLYTAFESYFLRIAKFFENDMEEPGWHRSRLERMTLRIEGMRPSLFGLDFLPRLDELRRFRHAFRNLYKTPLIPKKVADANEYATGIAIDFRPYHEAFDEFLRSLKQTLQDV